MFIADCQLPIADFDKSDKLASGNWQSAMPDFQVARLLLFS